MRNLTPIVPILILIGTLSGCKTRSVSQSYKADMDSTWNAVVAVAQRLSKDAPKLDKDKHRITTGMVYGGVTEEANTDKGNSETRRSVSMWRGIITLSPVYGGTRVTIKVQKASGETNGDFPITDQKDTEIGLTLWSNDTDWQQKILGDIQAELAKGK